MSLYGVEAWTRNADPFGVYFGLFASLAPLTRRDGVLYARPPVVGAGRVEGRPGQPAVLLAGIGVTAFDGASEGPLFNDVLPDLQTFFGDLGLGPERALESGFVVGLFAGVALVSLIWTSRRAGMPRVNGERPGRRARALADPDPGRLRRRALLLAARLPGPGPLAAGVRSARRRLRPVRRRRRDDRLRRRRALRRSGTSRSRRS